MAKIFIGQAVTGEDRNVLREECTQIVKEFENSGESVYCTVLEGKDFEGSSNRTKMESAFKEIDDSDLFFVILRSERRSEGMLMEVGYAFSRGKRIVIAIKKGVENTYLPEMGDKTLYFEDIGDLLNKIKNGEYNG